MTPFMLLVVLALILTAVSFVWNQYPLVNVAVILLSVALLIGGSKG